MRRCKVLSVPSRGFPLRKADSFRYTTFCRLNCAKRAYYLVIPSRGRWLVMESSTMGPVSHRELRRLAIKVREDLINCEEKLGATREFAELMHTAGALIIAITEPEEFRVSARRR